jgi:hypothetical protein
MRPGRLVPPGGARLVAGLLLCLLAGLAPVGGFVASQAPRPAPRAVPVLLPVAATAMPIDMVRAARCQEKVEPLKWSVLDAGYVSHLKLVRFSGYSVAWSGGRAPMAREYP